MAKHRMDPQERVAYLTSAPIPQLIRRMAVPTIISMMVTSFYNMVDTAFVGRIDTQASAAVGVSFAVMTVLQAFSFLFGHGSGTYMARRMGAGDYKDAERMASTGFFSVLLTGLLFSLTGIFLARPVAIASGATPTILPYAEKYLRIILIGAPFIMGSFVLNNQMRYQGCANIAMIGIVTGAVLNIGLDPVFIFLLEMGVAGAALATVISQAVGFFLLLYLSRRFAGLPLRPASFMPNAHYLGQILRGGVPSLCRQSVGAIASILLNHAAARWGGASADAAIAAMGIVSRITFFINSALIGFGQGLQPVSGTNYGAGNYRRVKEAFDYCARVGTAVLIVLCAAGIASARPLVRLFRDDPEVVRIGAAALRMQLLVFPLNVYAIVGTFLLQTIGMTGRSSLVTLLRQGIFFVPVILILPRFLGLAGVQGAQAVSDVLAFLVAVPLTRDVLKDLSEGRPFRSDRGDT